MSECWSVLYKHKQIRTDTLWYYIFKRLVRGIFHFACFQLSGCCPLHLKGKHCAGVLILLVTAVVYCFYWAVLLNPPQPVRTNKVVHIEIGLLSQPLVWADLQCFLPRTLAFIAGICCSRQWEVCFFFSPGSRRGCPLWSVRVSDAGWCLPQALDRTAWEHPHVFSPEAVSKRDCPATDAQVQTLQMTSAPNTAASRHSPSGHWFLF